VCVCVSDKSYILPFIFKIIFSKIYLVSFYSHILNSQNRLHILDTHTKLIQMTHKGCVPLKAGFWLDATTLIFSVKTGHRIQNWCLIRQFLTRQFLTPSLTLATLASIVCPCLTCDKRQGWNDSTSVVSVKWNTAKVTKP